MEFTQLSLTVMNASASVLVNGFPVANTKDGVQSRPIDLFLLENNTLSLTVTPEEKGRVQLRIETAAQGEIVDTSDASPALLNLNEEVTSQKTYTLTFNTPGKTLGKRLLGTPLTEQTALTYARTLAQLIQNKDYEKLATHFQPKFEDYAALYGQTTNQIAKDFISFWQQFTFAFDLNSITVQSYCSGRVFCLLHNNKPFITAVRDRGEYNMEVYIANVNGTPKIIR